ncbi:MAG: rane protein [Marmoricola sp.]|nr:rane protein [Marmoricola sp.]
MKIRNLILGVPVALALTLGGCAVEDTSGPNAADREAADSKTPDKQPAKPKGPKLSAEQEQAAAKARQYLDQQAFSKKGLIDQLKFEGFPRADAARAVNTMRVNWRNQAALKAKQYLDQQAFSKSGLIDQLKFEGFTQPQAEYGVSQTKLG